MSKKKDLKQSIEDEIKNMISDKASPDEGRMKLLALGIKMCALNAKLEESDYGGFFSADDEPGHSDRPSQRKGPKPASGLGEAGGTEH